MRKIQQILRAHCYDIAAYFVSITGLLFPRQAIAAEAPASVFISRQIPSTGCVYWGGPQGLPGVGTHSGCRIAAPGEQLVRELDGSLRLVTADTTPSYGPLDPVDASAPEGAGVGRIMCSLARRPADTHNSGVRALITGCAGTSRICTGKVVAAQ